MKIEKETLQKYLAALKTKPAATYAPTLDRNQQRQVVEYCLELIDAADGGPDIAKLRQELAEKENQLKLALTDIEQALSHGVQGAWDRVAKGLYITNLALKYLRSAKTKDFQSWKDYRVMVDEEFNTSV